MSTDEGPGGNHADGGDGQRRAARSRDVWRRYRLARARAAAGAAAGAVVLLIGVAGLPVGLLLIQRPLLAGFDPAAVVAQPMGWPLFAALGVAGGWSVWVWLVAATVSDVVAAARRGVPRLLPARLHAAVTALAGVLITAATPGTGHAAATAPAAAVHTPAMETAPQTVAVPPATVVPASGLLTASAPTGGAVRAPLTVTVRRGDTLWGIAGHYLGNPSRWPEIYHRNADRYDQHGRMRGGNHIEPAWVLILPDDATPPPGAQPGDPGQQDPGTQTEPGAGQTTAPTPSPPASTATPAPAVTASAAAPSGTTAPATGPPAAVGPSSASSAVPSRPATNPAPPPGPAPAQPHGITLPGGSWLDLGLATAIAAAAALVWAHRRRRYTRRPPSPDLRLGDPDVAVMPPVVRQIRRRLRGGAHDTDGLHPAGDAVQIGRLTDADDTPDQEDRLAHDDDIADPEPAPDLDLAAGDPPPDTAGGDPAGTEPRPSRTGPDATGDGQAPSTARPAVPSLAHPLTAVWPPAGLGLTGAGAEAAARGFLAAGLAAGGLDEPDQRSWVVMPAATATTLLGADTAALPHTPRLTVTAGLDDALDLLETQTLHRSRIVYAHEADTVADLRAADPTDEPLPPILLLADTTGHHQRTRIAALLAQGQRLDIHGVLLGAWPDGDTVVVAADGTTSPASGEGARHGNHPADVGRLATLTPAETSDLLTTLAESHTGQPQAPAPVEPAAQLSTPPQTAGPEGDGTPEQAASGPNPADPVAVPVANPEHPHGDQSTVSGSADERIDGNAVPDAATDGAAGPVVPTQAVAPDRAGSVEADAVVEAQPTTRPAADVGNDVQGEDSDAPDDDSVEESDAAADDADTGPGRVEVTVLGPAGIVDVPPGPTLRKKSVRGAGVSGRARWRRVRRGDPRRCDARRPVQEGAPPAVYLRVQPARGHAQHRRPRHLHHASRSAVRAQRRRRRCGPVADAHRDPRRRPGHRPAGTARGAAPRRGHLRRALGRGRRLRVDRAVPRSRPRAGPGRFPRPRRGPRRQTGRAGRGAGVGDPRQPVHRAAVPAGHACPGHARAPRRDPKPAPRADPRAGRHRRRAQRRNHHPGR